MRLMFISRIDPKKGLEVLLQAMTLLPDTTTLDIYGRGDDDYVTSLNQMSHDVGVAHRVRFNGHVEGDAKRAAFAGADLFVFPTHSENFGMVVAESLAEGVPAIVSHGAPWAELDHHGCGRWIPNTPQAFATTIEALRTQDLANMGEQGRRWMATDFNWDQRAGEMHALLSRLVTQARYR